MARIIYNLLLYLVFPFFVLRMMARSLKMPGYRQRFLERFGILDNTSLQDSDIIWIHAASVGEVFVAAPLMKSLLAQYPKFKLVVTTTTPTSSDLVNQDFGDSVYHVYAPWDLPGSVKRFLAKVGPKILILIERELWPNILYQTHVNGCSTVLVNARLSARSASRYARFSNIASDMISSLNLVACQSEEDASRFILLGLSPEQIEVTGSMKFDLEVSDFLEAERNQFRESNGLTSRFVVVAASTHPGEEKTILQSFAEVKKDNDASILILAPRHIERCDEVIKMCSSKNWRVIRHSEKISINATHDILLVDTMGDLLKIMGVADVAIMGGSFIPHGGHNMLEAAVWGIPILTGPYTRNFDEIAKLLVSAGAMLQIQPEALSGTLLKLMKHTEMSIRMGKIGKKLVETHRGSKDKTLALISDFLE